jgi:hypothetical protein
MNQRKSLFDRVSQVDYTKLTPIVRKALNDDQLVPDQWQWTAMDGAADGSYDSAVYRFQGTLHGDRRTWSVILKSIRAIPNQDSTARRYWRREYEIYQSGWLDSFNEGSLITPRCYQTEEIPGECCWLWLEDVSDGQPRPWSLDRFALAAYHLGQFNGRHLDEGLHPRFSWLSRDVLRQEAASVEAYIGDLHHKSGHPLCDRLLSEERCEKFRRLWEEKDLFISALHHLPQTINHLDCYSRNLYDRDSKTILIDWQLTGIAAAGADLSQILSGTLAFNDLRVHHARELEPKVFERYLEGLHNSGWRGDPRSVRLGYAAYASLHNLFRMLHVQNALKKETGQRLLQSKGGHPIERHVDQWIEMFEFFDDLSNEARQLINELDLY